MTTKLTTTITAAALAAFTAFAETNAPSAKSDETAALKARIEKLESDLATLRAQLFNEAPITNKNETNSYRPYGNSWRSGDEPDFKSEIEYTGTVTRLCLVNITSSIEPLLDSDKLRIKETDRKYKKWKEKRHKERMERLKKNPPPKWEWVVEEVVTASNPPPAKAESASPRR